MSQALFRRLDDGVTEWTVEFEGRASIRLVDASGRVLRVDMVEATGPDGTTCKVAYPLTIDTDNGRVEVVPVLDDPVAPASYQDPMPKEPTTNGLPWRQLLHDVAQQWGVDPERLADAKEWWSPKADAEPLRVDRDASTKRR